MSLISPAWTKKLTIGEDQEHSGVINSSLFGTVRCDQGEKSIELKKPSAVLFFCRSLGSMGIINSIKRAASVKLGKKELDGPIDRPQD